MQNQAVYKGLSSGSTKLLVKYSRRLRNYRGAMNAAADCLENGLGLERYWWSQNPVLHAYVPNIAKPNFGVEALAGFLCPTRVESSIPK